jgi:hypothetical protein
MPGRELGQWDRSLVGLFRAIPILDKLRSRTEYLWIERHGKVPRRGTVRASPRPCHCPVGVVEGASSCRMVA